MYRYGGNQLLFRKMTLGSQELTKDTWLPLRLALPGIFKFPRSLLLHGQAIQDVGLHGDYLKRLSPEEPLSFLPSPERVYHVSPRGWKGLRDSPDTQKWELCTFSGMKARLVGVSSGFEDLVQRSFMGV